MHCLINVSICLQLAGMKRPSPEPADNSLAKIQKKPKAQKKKKKRDPNEPQKWVRKQHVVKKCIQSENKSLTSFWETSLRNQFHVKEPLQKCIHRLHRAQYVPYRAVFEILFYCTRILLLLRCCFVSISLLFPSIFTLSTWCISQYYALRIIFDVSLYNC